jgi:hypothetical protein
MPDKKGMKPAPGSEKLPKPSLRDPTHIKDANTIIITLYTENVFMVYLQGFFVYNSKSQFYRRSQRWYNSKIGTLYRYITHFSENLSRIYLNIYVTAVLMSNFIAYFFGSKTNMAYRLIDNTIKQKTVKT